MDAVRPVPVKMHLWAAAALVAAFAIGAALLMTGPFNPFTDTAVIARGHELYAKHCASCHGKNLEGQANWKSPLPNGRLPAPPHDASGHTWHHTDDALAGVIKFGLKPYAGENYESDMPVFGAILGDEEIAAIVAYIKSTWPDREQAYQQRVTEQSKPASTGQ